MILEMNELKVVSGREAEFEQRFLAQRRTQDTHGYGPRSSRLLRKVGRPSEYLVALEWDSVEADVAAEAQSDGRAEREALMELVEKRLSKARWEVVE